MSMISKKQIKEKLEQMPCIWYFVIFKNQTKGLLNLRNRVNIINSVFAS